MTPLRRAWVVVLAIGLLAASSRANLVQNGSFESGSFESWSAAGATIVSAPASREGLYAARLAGSAQIAQDFPTEPGRTYKVSAWLQIVEESGNDWGGFSVSVTDYSTWNELGASPFITRAGFGSNWIKIAFGFSAASDRARLSLQYFGGAGRTMVVHVDDVRVFERPATNTPPQVTFFLSPTQFTNVPAVQEYGIEGDDPDGAVVLADWDFGDGALSQEPFGVRRVAIPGAYIARARIADDDGAVVETSLIWAATAPNWPAVTITNVIVAPTALVQGVATGHDITVRVSTDREVLVPAVGTTNWTAHVPLRAGWNRVLAQVHQADGKINTHEIPVRLTSTGALAILVREVTPTTVERWDPVEVRFDLLNSDATHPQFPYESDLSRGVHFVDGVTVDALFTREGDSAEYRVPAFLCTLYEIAERDDAEWMKPTGQIWIARFAPPRDGVWSVRIEAREAKGTALSDAVGFSVVAPTNALNHGPIRVSTNDWRFYEFEDGTPFLGGGFGLPFDRHRLLVGTTQFFARVGVGNATYFRFWASGLIWGNSWQPWNSRTLPAEGTVLAYMLSLDSAYGDALGAFRLDATPDDWSDPTRNPLIFQGFQGQSASLEPGKRYVVRIRWRTEDVTGPAAPGPYGVVVKFTEWPEPGQTTPYPAIVPHVYGDTPWHVAMGIFTARTFIAPYLVIALENVTGGRAFVDECAIHEVLADGRLGPALNGLPRCAGHLEFNPRAGACLDGIYREAQRRGLYIRMLINEKQEWALNHLSPSGLRDRRGGHFNEPATHAPTVKLHEWHWRHLAARFGAFRSLAGIEFVNEEAPGPTDHFRLLGHMARWWNQQAHRKPVSTSTWFGLATNAWKADFAREVHATDFHAYTVGNWLFPDEDPTILYDSAEYYTAFSRSWYEAQLGKPGHWGECSLFTAEGGEHPLLAMDTNGVWLHKWIWARCSEAFVYPTYWHTDNIIAHELYPLYGNWNRFMAGVPLANSRYRDVGASSAHPRLRIIGQKDVPAGHAFLWLDHRDHTWWRVVHGWPITAITAAVEIPMDRPNAPYRVVWYNTRTGLPTSTNWLSADSAGKVTLGVTDLLHDIAVHVYLDGESDYDGDGDGIPDQWEVRFVHRLDQMSANTDLDGDGFGDAAEYRAGTNPADSTSFLRIHARIGELSWPSAPGRRYQLQYTPDLVRGSWQALAAGLWGTPPTNRYTAEMQDGFYRVWLEWP